MQRFAQAMGRREWRDAEAAAAKVVAAKLPERERALFAHLRGKLEWARGRFDLAIECLRECTTRLAPVRAPELHQLNNAALAAVLLELGRVHDADAVIASLSGEARAIAEAHRAFRRVRDDQLGDLRVREDQVKDAIGRVLIAWAWERRGDAARAQELIAGAKLPPRDDLAAMYPSIWAWLGGKLS
jgi:tetratricopeptide (TPR) repeat protein